MRQRSDDPLITSEIETMKPAQCQDDLAHRNKCNRSMKRAHHEKFERIMRDRLWGLSGQPIIYDWDGNLLDGQHRLMACVRTGIPLRTLVVRGVDPAMRSAIDTGLTRNLGDYLQMKGQPQATLVAAAARHLWRYDHRIFIDRQVYPSVAEGDLAFEENPDLASREVLSVADRVPFNGGRGIYVFCYYVLRRIDPVQARDFFEKLITGIGLVTGDPILALRNRLIKAGQANSSNRGRDVGMRAEERAALIFKAWRFTVEGRGCLQLKWNDSEKFPYIG